MVPGCSTGWARENQNLPGFVVLCPGLPVNGAANWSNRFLPGIYQGATSICRIDYDPRNVLPYLQNHLLERSGAAPAARPHPTAERDARGAARPGRPLDARIASLEMAFRMQTAAQEAFDLGREPVRPRRRTARWRQGRFANDCLLARRLVERGVRVVQIYYGAGQPWDDARQQRRPASRHWPATVDQAIAALLKDLKQRGLLEDTLVLWGGEFGRTPASRGGTGRDHNHWGFSLWLAGGGVKGGMAYGATDEFGFAAAEKTHPRPRPARHHAPPDGHRPRDADLPLQRPRPRLTDVSGRVVRDLLTAY